MDAKKLAIELTSSLVRCQTVNPPGNESACVAVLAPHLMHAGFTFTYHDLAPGRSNLVAYLRDGRPVCFADHMDTVPLGNAQWSVDSFGGEIADGRLYGRGSSDMKADIAAFVAAALSRRDLVSSGQGIVLVPTACEETGCQGATSLLQSHADMYPRRRRRHWRDDGQHSALGKQGCVMAQARLALRERTQVYTAWGSKRDLWGRSHAGAAPTVPVRWTGARRVWRANVERGTMSGGTAINVVPHLAEIMVDIRTIPRIDHDAMRASLTTSLVENVDEVVQVLDLPSVFTTAKILGFVLFLK
jgi:succinyl-diaminopimelate desuccinylase